MSVFVLLILSLRAVFSNVQQAIHFRGYPEAVLDGSHLLVIYIYITDLGMVTTEWIQMLITIVDSTQFQLFQNN